MIVLLILSPAFVAGLILAAYYGRPALRIRSALIIVLGLITFASSRFWLLSEFPSMTDGSWFFFSLAGVGASGVVGYTVSAFVLPFLVDIVFVIRIAASFREPYDS